MGLVSRDEGLVSRVEGLVSQADIIAKHDALGYTPSHIDIPLSTSEMFNTLENRMKTP